MGCRHYSFVVLVLVLVFTELASAESVQLLGKDMYKFWRAVPSYQFSVVVCHRTMNPKVVSSNPSQVRGCISSYCLFICLFVYLFVCLLVCVFVSSFVCLFVRMCVHMFISFATMYICFSSGGFSSSNL